jgi:branched-subunit amino acid ABC-type transport system permease component
MFAYGLAIFWGALLLFLVQPLIARFILPWFGGGPAVWTTCMLFFQVLLLGGYAYAHFSIRRLRPRTQVVTHLGLLLAALCLLPITPSEAWKPTDADAPTAHILGLLLRCLGLPYLMLSSTGPLLQAWFSGAHPGVSPYRLYAL